MKTIRFNEDSFCIELVEGDEIIDSYQLEYPDCGYGGNEVYESPSEKLLAMCFYSGESDTAFFIFDVVDNKLNALINEDYSYGEATFMWSPDNRYFYRPVDSGERYDASDDGIYPVGRGEAYDVLADRKKSLVLSYDFGGFDMELIDFFEMRLIQDEDKVRVSLNGKTLTIQ